MSLHRATLRRDRCLPQGRASVGLTHTKPGRPGYLNAFEGRRAERWQYKNEREPLVDIGTRGKTWSHFHFKSSNWADIPGGGQRLCYNEIATKHGLPFRE